MSTKPRKTTTTKKPRLKHVVCKPCWELKYCPYGSLVEFFPLPDDQPPFSDVTKAYKSWITEVRSGSLKRIRDINRAIEAILSLEPKRWAWINQYQTEELCCSVFGHICPVFFSAEPFTETKQDRRIERGIPRDIMLKVVRRDGQVCCICHKNVPDDQIEFDHIIPHARGGPTHAENIRLLCRTCNRKKKNSLKEILAEDPLRK
jgi:5-methylcytosine-specific restriction endonuclease McrA